MTRFALLALALIAAAVCSRPAQANWTLCNDTSFVIEVAVSYPDRGRRVTEGWTKILPGACAIARAGELERGNHHFFGRASTAHHGGRREWAGATPLCVDSAEFSLAGEANCEEVGFETRTFVEVPIDADEWTTTLVEPADWDSEDARTAGLQRLLIDNGYAVRRVDGFEGRRTRSALAAFVRDRGLQGVVDQDELILALEEAAIEKIDQVGLRLCNRASATVWTAIARREGEGWESRGWWPLEIDSCAKVINETIDETDALYVYAGLRETEVSPDRPLSSADESFCLADTRFSIVGRENCQARGYSVGRFATLVPTGRGALTVEFQDADFISVGNQGLRR